MKAVIFKTTPNSMIKIVSLCFCLVCFKITFSQNPWSNPSYELGDLIVYSGSGASTRHLEQNYFGGKYNHYLKSPFLSLGFDYCFANSDALWGVGMYFSGAIGAKEYNRSSSSIDKLWTNSLAVVKFTHHNKFFVRKKIDMCSGYLIGARVKNYEKVMVNNEEVKNNSKPSVHFAAGISCMFKYYPTDFLAVYAEGALGYNVDLFQIGIARRIATVKNSSFK